ncbi:hypothetical protein [Paenibacillus kribbensis]|uniref:hypothetical protein n=1 Tax=Paenibacillus kribbensis TaxID=172713 RepID=UPI00210A06F6|nr:hypothetical protein [Paenibacillus kribbensis]
MLPELNMAAAVISSSEGSSVIAQMLANELLLSALQGKNVIQELKQDKSYGIPVKADMPQELSLYTGIYSGSIVLKVDMSTAGELSVFTIAAPNSPAQKYTYTADGSFVNEEGTEKIKFVVEKNGRTYLWSRSYISVPRLGQTAISEYSAERLETNELSKEVMVFSANRGQRKANDS